MELEGEAKLLRIFIGESDKLHHTALHEAIVKAARTAGLAGATAWRGLIGYGASSRLRTDKSLDLSSDLPLIIEIVDDEAKIDAFLPQLGTLIEQANSGGLVTVEKVHILKYRHGG